MKRLQAVLIACFSFFVLLSQSGTALAQDGNCSSPVSIPVIRDVMLNVATRVDAKLNTWVSGDSLTDPEGKDFVADLAGFIRDLVSYIAECLEDILIWLNFV